MENSLNSAKKETRILIFSSFLAGLCSIVYELLISTTSSYFLGDSVTQFSLTIGIYMAAMGLGTYLSRFISGSIITKFILMEIFLAISGGFSVFFLYTAFALTEAYSLAMFLITVLIGTLIGMEIPLLTRILEKHYTLKLNISNVLSWDYLGALLATLLFPFLLLPLLGIMRTSLVFGLINLFLVVINLWCFSSEIKPNTKKLLITLSLATFIAIVLSFIYTSNISNTFSRYLYRDTVIYSEQTPYQNIVMTKRKEDTRLFLNGNLQFSSKYEYRYHESLVHIPLSIHPAPRNVLILGGGDGLAVRELLKHSSLQKIILVDLDPEITSLAQNHPILSKINKNSLKDPKVEILNQDAFVFINEISEKFDIIISDLPDPNNLSLSRLYSKEFYFLLSKAINPKGIFITQATSPYASKEAFWCIYHTIKETPLSHALPLHAHIPSFGEWGFILASLDPSYDFKSIKIPPQVETQFLTEEKYKAMQIFAKDEKPTTKNINTIDSPKLLEAYLKGWKQNI